MSVIRTLSPKQRKALESLLTSGNVADAATAANCTRGTLYRWMQLPVFQDALREGEAEALESLSRALVSLGDKATETLRAAMDDIKAPWGVRVRGADVVLTHILRLRELIDIESRLAALEQRTQGEVNNS